MKDEQPVCQWFENPHPEYPRCGKPAVWVWFGSANRGKGPSRRTINWECFYCDQHNAGRAFHCRYLLGHKSYFVNPLEKIQHDMKIVELNCSNRSNRGP